MRRCPVPRRKFHFAGVSQRGKTWARVGASGFQKQKVSVPMVSSQKVLHQRAAAGATERDKETRDGRDAGFKFLIPSCSSSKQGQGTSFPVKLHPCLKRRGSTLQPHHYYVLGLLAGSRQSPLPWRAARLPEPGTIVRSLQVALRNPHMQTYRHEATDRNGCMNGISFCFLKRGNP